MPNKDTISKELLRHLVLDMATYLLGLDLASLEELPGELHRVEARRADIVMRATDSSGSQFILHLELQNSNDVTMPLRMMRYFTDIALMHGDTPVHQYVIYTGKQPCRMASCWQQIGIDYRYNLIDMHTLDCEKFIAADNPDALVMAILCDFKGMDELLVLERIVSRIIQLTHTNRKRMTDYLLMVETLSENRDLENLVKQLETQMLSEMNLEKMPSYMIGMEKGMERGIEQGRSVTLQVLRMLRQAKPIAEIAAQTGVAEEEVAAMQQELLGE